MKRFVLLLLALCALLIALWALGLALGLPVDADPRPWLARWPRSAGALVFALLAADGELPVPSSLLMIASGAIAGPWIGALWSLGGALAAVALGWWLGRRGGGWYERALSAAERERAAAWLARNGWVAIAASRPVPVLAEALALAAGAAGLPFGRVLLSGFAGALPICVLYALVGAGTIGLASPWLAFAIALAASAPLWWLGRRWGAPASRAPR